MGDKYLQFTKKKTAIIAVISLLLIGYIDFMTGNELSLSVFYLLPIALVSVNIGRIMGVWTAVISAVVETAIQMWGGLHYSSALIHFWNMGILMSIYIVFAVLSSVLRDAYEREKGRSAELKRVNEKLEASYKEMESFSYSVSHDLRAPLRIISGLSDIVLTDYEDKIDENVKKLLRSIRGNTERLEQLILALLNLSKIGRQDINIDEIDMEETTAVIVDDLKAAVPERNINVTVKNLPTANGDITLIRQALTNLLSNAFKFTRGKDIAIVEIGGWRQDGEDVYYVKDNGAGFDMEHANKLFGVFQRLHGLKEFEGSGIGLSIVERIIRRHGGKVWAEGRKNEGATFYFALPEKQS